MSLYTTQTDLQINVQTNKNLTGADVVKLRYRDPRNGTGDLDVDVTDAIKGNIRYTTPQGEPFTIAGDWRMWVYVEQGGRVSVGEPFTLKFKPEGQ